VPAWWHGHELVFGFAAAAICGFLLTAVPKWTASEPLRGGALGALVLLWVAGRAVMWAAGVVPAALVALVDLALFPAMAVAMAKPILRARNVRNYGFPVLLAALFVANAMMHAEVMGWARTGRVGLHGATYLVVIMVAVVSGRIVPSFTAGALARRGSGTPVRQVPWLGRLAVGAVVAAAACQVLQVGTPWRGGTALAAAALLAARAGGWRATATLREPIVWVLHAGHGWLMVGFALLAWAELVGGIAGTAALHALTAGAIGTMVLAVMTRASLGHTGRPLRASAPITAAYALVLLGALVRVFGPMVAPAGYVHAVLTGGVLWALGYALFVVVYAPILLRPRTDGLPG
jgi:uncharacterized protein involved in response to NO